jgi:hypothetical protein
VQQTNSTNRREIAAIVSRLLNHYWTAADPVEMRQAQIEDWIVDLEEFPPAIVEDACAEWRRMPSAHRPTPGDIRTRCARMKAERAGSESKPIDMEAYARSVGFSSHLERMDAIAAAERKKLNGDWNHPERWHPDERPTAVRGFKSLAASMGVRAKEFTPEQLAAGRRELGLEEP